MISVHPDFVSGSKKTTAFFCQRGVLLLLTIQITPYNIPGQTREFGISNGGESPPGPQAEGMRAACPGSQCSLSLLSISQEAFSPRCDWSPKENGGGDSSGFLGNFTLLLLLNGLFGQQGVLRLRLLQLGLVRAGEFPHVRFVYHFLKAILGLGSQIAVLAPTRRRETNNSLLAIRMPFG